MEKVDISNAVRNILTQFVVFMALWYILWPFGKFCGHLVYFMVIWFVLWPFGIFYGHLVYFMAIESILW
jgi:hypothetical protein